MQICARCKKRPAVIFITRMEKDKTINEGICIKCAKELGLKPVDDIMQKMGITDEDLDRMDVEMSELLNEGNLPTPADHPEDLEGRTPPIDFRKLFGGLMSASSEGAKEGASAEAERAAADQEEKERG